MRKLVLDEQDRYLYVHSRAVISGAASTNDRVMLEAGVTILQAKGIKASGKELARISRLFDNHDLALTLLGNYLREVHDGDPARLDAIPIWLDPCEEGRHVRRMLAAYCRWLHDTPEIALMFLLGLVNRPISIEEAQELTANILSSKRKGWFKQESPPKLLMPLKKLSAAKYRTVRGRLSELDLLFNPDGGEKLFLEPVVRDYFYQQLQVRFPDALRAAQNMSDVDFVLGVAPNMHNDLHVIAEIEKQLASDLKRKNWRSAARSASRLCRRQRMLGNLPVALQYARQSAAYASLCADQSILRQSLNVLLPLLQSTGDRAAAGLIRQKLAELDECVQVEVVF